MRALLPKWPPNFSAFVTDLLAPHVGILFPSPDMISFPSYSLPVLEHTFPLPTYDTPPVRQNVLCIFNLFR